MDEFESDEDQRHAAQRKRGARDSMFLQSNLRRGDGQYLSVRVRNISAGGVLVETATPFARGERVSIELRGIGYVEGSVAWSATGRFGVAFDQDIDPKLTRKPLPSGPKPAPMGPTVVLVRRPGLRFE